MEALGDGLADAAINVHEAAVFAETDTHGDGEDGPEGFDRENFDTDVEISRSLVSWWR